MHYGSYPDSGQLIIGEEIVRMQLHKKTNNGQSFKCFLRITAAAAVYL